MPTALIIGAGPAGSMAALCLRNHNWQVTLIEQHRFPRDKVCGECLSSLGYEVLNRAGLSSAFHSLSPVELTRTTFHARDGKTFQSPLPRPMWGISRRTFDDLLLNHARKLGATIRQPARCEEINPQCAKIHDLITNQVETLEANCVLVADGKCALSKYRPHTTGDMGIKVHWSNVTGPENTIELFALKDHYGGLAPINGALWNSAFSVPAARLRNHSGNLNRLIDEMIEENLALTRRLKNAHRVGPILASPLPRFGVTATRFPIGVIPIGNAAAAIEPIGGEGMGLALHSAEIAADWLDSRHQLGLDFNYADLAPAFKALWTTKRTAYRAAALAVSCKCIATASIALLKSGLGQQAFSRVLEFLVRQDARAAQA